VGGRKKEKKREKGLLNEVGLITTVTHTHLAENMDPSGYVHRRSGDLLLVCVCQRFLASLLCDITTRAHV
jgi:hypothetical protein